VNGEDVLLGSQDRFDLDYEEDASGRKFIVRAECRMCGKVVFNSRSPELDLAEVLFGPGVSILMCARMAIDAELHYLYCNSAKAN
jgi:hypothetical protein